MEEKIKWKGGRYGECPYITLGDKKYYIQDHKFSSNGHYEYALLVKDLREGFDYEFRSNLAEWEHAQLARAYAIFERWFLIKFKAKPLMVDSDVRSRKYERGHLTFWVEKQHGNPPRIICRSTGQLVDGWYESFKECKRCANRIMAKEIERYSENQTQQLSIEF